MLELYLDDSGSHTDRTLVIGGFLATSDNWEQFCARCNQLKSEYNIPYVHAVDVTHGRSKQFRHLSTRQREQLLAELGGMIGMAALWGTFAVISPTTFKQLTTPKWRSRHGSPMKLCVETILLGVWDRFTNRGETTEELKVVIETGHRNCEEIVQAVLQYKQETDPYVGQVPIIEHWTTAGRGTGLLVQSVLVSDKIKMSPLWAADLIAFCIHGQTIDPENPRYSLKRVHPVEVSGFYIDESMIAQYVRDTMDMDDELAAWKETVHAMTATLKPLCIFPVKHPLGIEWKRKLR